MKKITYICVFYNASSSIVNFLKHLNANIVDYQKEYIFIDDGSEDETLQALKEATSKMPRVTILTSSHNGKSYALNMAFKLASGDYIHFLEQEEEIESDASKKLINSLVAHEASAAIGKIGGVEGGVSNSINNPSSILQGKPYSVRIGMAGTMITSELLAKINKCDEEIYTPNISLSLASAKFGKISMLNEVVSNIAENSEKDKRFEGHNNLKSVYNFCRANPDFMCPYIPDLLTYLALNCTTTRGKIYYRSAYLKAKYITSLNLDGVLKMYQNEINKLF